MSDAEGAFGNSGEVVEVTDLDELLGHEASLIETRYQFNQDGTYSVNVGTANGRWASDMLTEIEQARAIIAGHTGLFMPSRPAFPSHFHFLRDEVDWNTQTASVVALSTRWGYIRGAETMSLLYKSGHSTVDMVDVHLAQMASVELDLPQDENPMTAYNYIRELHGYVSNRLDTNTASKAHVVEVLGRWGNYIDSIVDQTDIGKVFEVEVRSPTKIILRTKGTAGVVGNPIRMELVLGELKDAQVQFVD